MTELLRVLAIEDRPPVDMLREEIYALWNNTVGKKLFVELGTLIGGGAFIASFAAEKVVTIDLFEDLHTVQSAYDIFSNYSHCSGDSYTHANVSASLACRPNVTVVKGCSYEKASMFEDNTVDALLIDGDHSADGVRKDFYAWFPKVTNNGIIMFHDYGMGWTSVKDFVDELLDSGTVKFVDIGDKMMVTRKEVANV